MKTRRLARRIRQARVIGLCLGMLAIASLEFRIFGTWAARVGQTGGAPDASAQAWCPNVGIADFMAAVR